MSVASLVWGSPAWSWARSRWSASALAALAWSYWRAPPATPREAGGRARSRRSASPASRCAWSSRS